MGSSLLLRFIIMLVALTNIAFASVITATTPPAAQDDPGHIVVSLSQDTSVSKVVHSLFSGYQYYYWKVSPQTRVSWHWQSGQHDPLEELATHYHIFVVANATTHKVGIAKRADIAKAFTSLHQRVWVMKKGKTLHAILQAWANTQHKVVHWELKHNPLNQHERLFLGDLPEALNAAIAHSTLANRVFVEQSSDGHAFFIAVHETYHALTAPALRGQPWFVVRNGSLKSNVERFAKRFHYRLVWQVVDNTTQDKADYKWTGSQKIEAPTIQGILSNMLSAYPVVVRLFEVNRVICVTNTGSCSTGEKNAA